MFLFISFIQIRFWHSQSYLIYILFFLLLLGVKYFGLTSSGSKRWLDLYFMNLQPSELMKIGLILFLAKYYHRISIENINQLRGNLDKIYTLQNKHRVSSIDELIKIKENLILVVDGHQDIDQEIKDLKSSKDI